MAANVGMVNASVPATVLVSVIQAINRSLLGSVTPPVDRIIPCNSLMAEATYVALMIAMMGNHNETDSRAAHQCKNGCPL